MRALMILFLLAGCGSLDTSQGASGFPDSPITQGNQRSGQITTGGQIILNRDLPPDSPRRVF